MDKLEQTCARFFAFSNLSIYCYTINSEILFHFPDYYSELRKDFVKECMIKIGAEDLNQCKPLILTLNTSAHLAIIPLSEKLILFIGPIALNPDSIVIPSIYKVHSNRHVCTRMNYEQFLNAVSILRQLCTGTTKPTADFISVESVTPDIQNTFNDSMPNSNLRISYTGEALEQRLMTLIEKGDVERLKTQLEFSSYVPIERMSTDSLQHQKYLFIVFMTMSVRAAIRGGVDEVRAFNLVGNYCLRMDKSTEIIEIASLIYNMALSLCREVRKYGIKASLSMEIRKCCSYILSHLYSDLSLPKIADAINMSTRNLSKRFIEEMKTTPMNYVQTARIEEAKFLLRYSKHTILEISNALHFSSQSHFTKVFRTLIGITPKQYRENKNI